MAALKRAVASLRVIGNDLVPDEVSALVGAQPSQSYARGDAIPSKRGVAGRVARTGLWSLEAPETEPANLDAQVAWLIERLTPDLTVWHELADRFEVDLFCGWFMESLNEGVQLAPQTLLLLGERRIVLDLDIYGADERE